MALGLSQIPHIKIQHGIILLEWQVEIEIFGVCVFLPRRAIISLHFVTSCVVRHISNEIVLSDHDRAVLAGHEEVLVTLLQTAILLEFELKILVGYVCLIRRSLTYLLELRLHLQDLLDLGLFTTR